MSLAWIHAAVARHPSEASGLRKAAGKFALIRGIKKIAAEVRTNGARAASTKRTHEIAPPKSTPYY